MTEAPEQPTWGALAERLRPFVRSRVASDADADDVLQEVLLRMHRGLGGLGDPARLIPWMFRIARTAIADHLRARARHPVAEAVDTAEEGAPLEGDDDATARALAQVLASFVAALPSPYREAITLTEIEGRGQKDAAEMLGISLSALKSRVLRGRAKLREMLHDCCEIALDARGKVIACDPRSMGAAPDGCCR